MIAGEERNSLEYFGIALEKCAIIQIDFHQKFKPLRRLGNGATAAVYSAVRTRDGEIVAVKAFNKSKQFAVGNGKGQVLMALCRGP
jgi:serine/threonine protein kinase